MKWYYFIWSYSKMSAYSERYQKKVIAMREAKFDSDLKIYERDMEYLLERMEIALGGKFEHFDIERELCSRVLKKAEQDFTIQPLKYQWDGRFGTLSRKCQEGESPDCWRFTLKSKQE